MHKVTISTGIKHTSLATKGMGTISLPSNMMGSDFEHLGRQFLAQTKSQIDAASSDTGRFKIVARAKRKLESIENSLTRDAYYRGRGESARFTTAGHVCRVLGL